MSGNRRARVDGSGRDLDGGRAVIVAARIGPSHDGTAELVVEVGEPGGALTVLSLEEDAAFNSMAAADIHDISELVGRSWQVVLGGAERVAHLTDSRPDDIES
jgi:hypothetical protein